MKGYCLLKNETELVFGFMRDGQHLSFFSAVMKFFASIYWFEILRFHLPVHILIEKIPLLFFLNPANSIVTNHTNNRDNFD